MLEIVINYISQSQSHRQTGPWLAHEQPCTYIHKKIPNSVKGASQFKKSQTVVSTTERYFTLSVVCLMVECTKDSVRVTKRNIQIVVGRLGFKWIERSILYNYDILNKKK